MDPSSSPQPGVSSPLTAQQQAQLTFQQQMSALQPPAQQRPEDASTIAMMLQQQQQLIAMLQQQQQQQAPASHHIVATIGQLDAFDGRGSLMDAELWMRKAEYRFAAAEALLGITAAQSAAARLLTTARALTDDAGRWFATLPSQPRSWDEFCTAFRSRFGSPASTDAKLSELQRLVATAQKIREKFTVEGLRRYATQFMQLAGQIPSDIMSDYLKRKSFAEGLPQKHAEYALSKNRSDKPPALHALVDDVLARALDRAMSSAAPSALSSGDAMQLDSISLCAAQFGISRDEAARYVEPSEGWAPHETSGPSATPPASSPSPASSPAGDEQIERLLNAFAARFGSASSGSSGASGRGQSQRRNVPSGIRDVIPDALIKARKEAGLCVKCGVVKYEPGGKGHSSRTCQAAADKTTSVAEGRKKANF
jgi:hypothetical protein